MVQTELHLDRLTLIASSIVLRFLNIHNGSFILSEATHYSALALVRSVQEYLAVNMESLLESRMLDHLHPAVIKQFANFVSRMQAAKSPTIRNNVLGRLALDKHADWLALQDFPAPIVRSAKELRRRDSMKLSPPSPTAKSRPPRPVKATSFGSPILSPQALNDDIFSMDEEEGVPLQNLYRSPPWKAPSAPRYVTYSVSTHVIQLILRQSRYEGRDGRDSINTGSASTGRSSNYEATIIVDAAVDFAMEASPSSYHYTFP